MDAQQPARRYGTLICEYDPPVATVVMNRPHKLNTADFQMYRDLEHLIPVLAADPETRAIILTGAGDRAFAAGDDISIFCFDQIEGSLAFIDLVSRVFLMFERCPKPIIAAVNGYALGYGFEICLACDMAIAAQEARFGLPEITVGAVPINTVTRGLEVIRRRTISYLSMTGTEWLTAPEAMAIGMVNEVVLREQLMPRARQLAQQVARWSPIAVSGVKRILNRNADLHYYEVIDTMPAVMFDEEVTEGRTAFLEKRPARFPTHLVPDLD